MSTLRYFKILQHPRSLIQVLGEGSRWTPFSLPLWMSFGNLKKNPGDQRHSGVILNNNQTWCHPDVCTLRDTEVLCCMWEINARPGEWSLAIWQLFCLSWQKAGQCSVHGVWRRTQWQIEWPFASVGNLGWRSAIGLWSDPLRPRPINNYKQIVSCALCWLMLKLLLKVLISSCYRLSAGVRKITAPTEMGECNQA